MLCIDVRGVAPVPELPDIHVYVESLERVLRGSALVRVRLVSAFLLRSVDPPLDALHGRAFRGAHRLGKRIVLRFDGDLHLVLHLMIAGRLQWKKPDASLGGRIVLAGFDFERDGVPLGTLVLTEAGSTKRARLHAVRGAAALAEHDPGGLEVLDPDVEVADFAASLRAENHTLKRALTDPSLFSGIGNAYSDEILHRARLSPFIRTAAASDAVVARLFEATRAVLAEWIERLRAEVGDGFPSKVTAFRPEMAVHGRYREPCPVCGDPVQRVAFAKREFNYCATCQTGGKLLADRALSNLMRGDWPRTLEELELRRRRGREGPGSGTSRSDTSQ
ncbi:putative formamidopyrimidine-DNA glycosylase-like protein [Planctomycetes bacterium Pla163]|uniref:Putative formamidopyrimidine-DNA glycosylase-like protein n=1 Tax=Rohdeia mirabilis TaxID=2528008 RepID=A0A518D4H8_9BACT|nr:putative formamidopyrimidine-DNA glycosylase-like protein [Planctomycetes bacterium Pla163]